MAKKSEQPETLEVKNRTKIIPELQKLLKVKNFNAVPRITKVQVNVGIGSYINSGNKDFSNIENNIALITGQKPIVTKSRKAISNFKIREGMPNGVTVTLRGERMYSFLSRLINIALPRVRDFRGISNKSFDGHGNFHLGIQECTVFPEINPDDVSKIHGLQISIITTAKNDKEGYELLKLFGFPFKESKK